ncbi:MAG: glycine betaine ABC transporter substrate-binding protein [Marinobacter sp.]|uniref:glycine betaine ABC transporter substrate-binding protein n=1 Tax=Marinobacter sp. TaxID=50741 RepID=UPI003297FC54
MNPGRLLLLLLWLHGSLVFADDGALTVGSKTFTESHVLAELVVQRLEMGGYPVERKIGLGGTMVVWEALRSGAVDVYPEYSGTLAQAILQRPDASLAEVEAALATEKLQLLATLGFNNTYVIVVDGALARERDLSKISDLRQHPDLRVGLSLEFLNRADGWPALRAHYQLPQSVSGLEHALAYSAIGNDQLDVTDAYSTDGDLEQFDLQALDDDLQFFPRYDAILLGREDLPIEVKQLLAGLEGSLTEQTVRSLNAAAGVDGVSPRSVVRDYLGRDDSGEQSVAQSVLHNTLVHLKLTGIALTLACVLAIPLALLLTQYARAAGVAVYLAGLLQTIPSLALLAMLVPLLGLGQVPAILALFLYSLLPILRNTLTGIASVDPLLREVAEGMGLSVAQRLRHVEIPLAMPMILAGVKTAAIISIGTATLAAFVGAGGLGEPIVTGLNLNDHGLILQGALPAAGLAIVTEFLFECLERAVVPRHLAVAG